MANIKNLRMAKAICADSRINISKSMFGLRTNVTYVPTNSVVDVITPEYSASDGDKLKVVLESSAEKLIKAAADFRPQPTVNGNYMAEVCLSRDHAFCAVQLLRFVQLNYEPVTDLLIFEGEAARAVSLLF